jgi:hypothetical protein
MDSAEVLTALATALPSEALIIDRDITRSLSHDEAVCPQSGSRSP